MVPDRRCIRPCPKYLPGACAKASHYGWRRPFAATRNPGPDGVFPNPMTKRLSFLSALLVLAALAMVPAAQAKPFSGVADQRVETLQDARFQKSGIKKYRVAVSYDQVRQGTKRGASAYAKSLLARQDEFFRLAKQQRLDVMVSFYRTSMLSPKRAAASLPSVSQFRKDFRAFRKRYPQIKKFSNWNEINFKIAQPTGRNPKRAGQFYLMLRKECRGGKCSPRRTDSP